MTRADALARLRCTHREALLACGLDDVSDASVAGAIADADAELAHAATGDGALVRVLRRRVRVLRVLHEYLAETQRARRTLAGETT